MDKSKYTYLVCFILAFSIRIFFILITPEKDTFTDIKIYRDMGQMITNGINPYDFNDKIKLRNQLRTDKDNYDEFLCSNQKSWDFYSGSNLPLATLFVGGIEFMFPSYKAYRYVFAFFDSILAVFILAFVLKKWRITLPNSSYFKKIMPILQKYLPLLLGLFLGAISPVLFHWGTVISEIKGIGLLLMLSSIYYSDSSDKRLSLFVSPVLLGCSVSFIGLGVFIAPLCMYNIYKNNANSIKTTIRYSLISFIAVALWLVPFMPEILPMMAGRIGSSSTPNAIPTHGAMWQIIYSTFPHTWSLIKNIFILLYVAVVIIGVFRKRLNMAMVSASVLFLFSIVYLINGSMDRMNIAILTVIIILGCYRHLYFVSLLSMFYILYGIYILQYYFIHNIFIQYNDGLFVFVFTGLYFIFLVVQIFSKKLPDNEVIHSHTSLQGIKQISLIAIFVILFVFINIHILVNLNKKSVEKILYQVGMGKLDPENVELTSAQRKEIIILISNDTNGYNAAQKSLIIEKSGKEILYQVGMGKLDPKNVELTSTQRKEIITLISTDTNSYNAAQKSLIIHSRIGE